MPPSTNDLPTPADDVPTPPNSILPADVQPGANSAVLGGVNPSGPPPNVLPPAPDNALTAEAARWASAIRSLAAIPPAVPADQIEAKLQGINLNNPSPDDIAKLRSIYQGLVEQPSAR